MMEEPKAISAEMMVAMVLSVVVCGFVGLVVFMYKALVLKPSVLRLKLQRQGIRGPPPSFLLGNIPDMKRIQAQLHPQVDQPMHADAAHDWPSRVFPHIQHWQNEYGPIFMYSVGNIQQLCVTDPEMVKEMSIYTSLNLGKPNYLSKDRGPLLGQGILTSNGSSWLHQRKVIAPEFYKDKVKSMVNLMVDATASILKPWEDEIEKTGGLAEIRVDQDLRCLSADVISKASFGSNYAEGKEIFSKLRRLQMIMSIGTYGVPGLRHIPNKSNREMWKLEREVNSSILKMVKSRKAGAFDQKDFLQIILEAAESNDSGCNGQKLGINLSDKLVVSNCKNIYFAGHETTAVTASWCLMLLAAHHDWQARVRTEVLEICRGSTPDANMLRSMKSLTMVIQETLRLYPPTSFLAREAFEDLKFKDIQIPKGLTFWIPIVALHQNPQIWGPDVYKFKPERFSQGTMGACKIPQAYMPFGLGPRVCAGQHFAMVQLKIILSLILSKFEFSLSPTYRHSPVFRMVMEPEHGVLLHMRRVDLDNFPFLGSTK